MTTLLENVAKKIRSGDLDREIFIRELRQSAPLKHGRKKLTDPSLNVVFRLPQSVKISLLGEAKEKGKTLSKPIRERLLVTI